MVDDIVNIPQATNCTTITFESEGVTNSILTTINRFGYNIEYDSDEDVYRVGGYSEDNDSVFDI